MNYIETAEGCVQMIFKMIDEVNNTTMSEMAMLLWILWWRRNQKCWNDITPTVSEVIRRAKEQLWTGNAYSSVATQLLVITQQQCTIIGQSQQLESSSATSIQNAIRNRIYTAQEHALGTPWKIHHSLY
jgi:hypothetical protein